MTISFKNFRADFKGIIHNMSHSECFRTTGDCDVRRYNDKRAPL